MEKKIIKIINLNLIILYMSERKVSEVNKSNIKTWMNFDNGHFYIDEFRKFFSNVYRNSSKILDEFGKWVNFTSPYYNIKCRIKKKKNSIYNLLF